MSPPFITLPERRVGFSCDSVRCRGSPFLSSVRDDPFLTLERVGAIRKTDAFDRREEILKASSEIPSGNTTNGREYA